MQEPEMSFFAMVDKHGPDGCWEWLGYKDKSGHGHFGGKTAYRVSYCIYKGPIPYKYHVHHLCGRPSCVNPEHLKAVSRSDHSKLHPDIDWLKGPEPIRKNRPPSAKAILARFRKKYYVDERGCWIWMAAKNHFGYGAFSEGAAHRFSYTVFVGEIPKMYDIHHKCGEPSCVNPDHLEAVSRKKHVVELTPRSIFYKHARKTHCPQGHPYDEENTWRDKHGQRHCMACHRKRAREADYRKAKRHNVKQVLGGLCRNGHRLVGGNVYHVPDKGRSDRIRCKQCYADAKRRPTGQMPKIVPSVLGNI